MGADIRKQELRPDSRTLTSDRWLTPDEVNCFKDEVKSSSVRLLDPLRFYTHGFGSRPKGSKIMTGIQMTGKMSSQQVLTRAWTGGGMLDLKSERRCLRSLIKQEFSLHRAAIDLFYWDVIW
jgi:hypothetical protein